MSMVIRGGASVTTLSFINALAAQNVWGIRPDLDPRIDGEYTTDGTEALIFELSVGQGRGSSKLEVEGADFEGVVESLSDFDPDAELSEDMKPSEVIKRTIRLSPDGSAVQFKISNAKHSRSVTVPRESWTEFVELWKKWQAGIEDGSSVASCRQAVEEVLAQQARTRAAQQRK